MPEKIQFIEKDSRKIVLLDFISADAPRIAGIMSEFHDWLARQTPRSVLTLSDVTDLPLDPDVIQLFKDFTLYNKPYVKAAAVVGIRGLRKITFNTVMAFSGRKIQTFDTREDAVDWLIRQA